MQTMDRGKITAYYEAGHAVAQFRFGVPDAFSAIDWSEGALERVIVEGKQHVSSAAEAEKQVLCCCAGYAALIAQGLGSEEASQGAADDFENAGELIETWGLSGTLDEWRVRAMELMEKDNNIRAVEFVGDALMKYLTLTAEYVDVLIERADGDVSDEEWREFVASRYPGMD
jgi:hypothetical protein